MRLKTRSGIMAAGLLGVMLTTTVAGAATALNGRLTLRPLTPSEKKDYSLSTLQGASGLSTVGVGQPAYLDALVGIDVSPTNILDVQWSLTTPLGSAATLLASPLGMNVPAGDMIDRLDAQVVSRKMLRPDVVGQYTVSASIITADNGTTNVSRTITAATYVGADTCAYCHSGGQKAPNTWTSWTNTAHAHMLESAIDGKRSDHYGPNCISCHTVGYDVNTNAVNGGFDDVAKQLGWTFPTVLTNGNWAAMPSALKTLANIQCENCHGPGSQHMFSEGVMGNPNKISVSMGAGNCGQCHDSKNNHKNNAEWANSKHAIAVEETEAGCSRCHSARGFANYANGVPAVATPYDTITCAACHDAHTATNEFQLRAVKAVTLMDNKTTVTKGGAGLMCMNCHISRRDATNYVEVTKGSNRFGPHHGPQTDMLVGANAITYGKNIPSSAHRDVVEDSCVTCHMQVVAATNSAFLRAGGHTFAVSAPASGTKAAVQLTDACKDCHGQIDSFDFKRQDYDGDGIVDGVQTEVKHLLDKLAYMLPPVGPKSALTITSSWNTNQLKAAYNYQFVLEDGSFGVHNLSYAVGLLKASIADLSGDANNDGLADWWQIQYFGSINNPNAAPNASPAGDGIPNWLKCAMRLDPTIPGMKVPDGVVWVNGTKLGGAGTNTVQIYTAAEVAFNTEVGKTYQIQTISSLSANWVNVGDEITGTGNSVSYVTPTRQYPQQYYRVVIR